MNGNYLPDTNILIALFAQEANVIQQFGTPNAIFLSSVVLGELYYGARRSGRVDANVARIDTLAQRNTVLACDQETAEEYGKIKEALRQKGRMIPDNDIWIAATAIQHNLTLATRDAHFDEVDTLLSVRW